MDQPKIERLLRLMKMMSGSVDYSVDELAERLGTSWRSIYRYIDTFKEAGFVVEKMRGNVYKLVKMPRGSVDFDRLIHFSEEEAYIVNSLINGIDESNTLKANLKKKLSAVYDSTSVADYVGNKSTAANVEALGQAIKGKKKALLKNYASAHSRTTRDRLVEPFAFGPNFIDVWAYDLDRRENRVFKVARIEWVNVLEEDWTDEASHQKSRMDCFRMHSFRQTTVRLRLSLRAKNLLLEEYPMAREDLKEDAEGWVLETMVSDMAGVGRFVAGLADEIDILDGDALRAYLHHYTEAYMSKF